jgi:hypothetical protein
MPYTPYYDPTGWVDDPSTDSPISAAALNHIEAGIVAAAATADAAIPDPGGEATNDALLWNGSAWVPDTIADANIAAAAAIDPTKLDYAGTSEGDILQISSGVPAWGAAAAAASVIPVQLNTPASSVTAIAGNAFWTVVGLTDWDAGHWEFVKDVDGKAYGQVLVPSGVTSATLRLLIAANATTGVTRLGVGYAAVASTESLNPGALTDVTKQDITVPATAYLRKDVTFSLTGLSGADVILLEVFHEGSHGNDTLAVNTLLFGAWLEAA